MTSNDDKPTPSVDQLLTLHARQWNDRQPAPPPVPPFRDARARRRYLTVLGAAAAVAAVVTSVALVSVKRSSHDPASPAPASASTLSSRHHVDDQRTTAPSRTDNSAESAPTIPSLAIPTHLQWPALAVRDGDRVAGRGWIVHGNGGNLLLCGPAVGAASGTDANQTDQCHGQLAKLQPTNDVDIPTGSGPFRVEGTWSDGAITLDRQPTVDINADRIALPATPCPPPAGGWTGKDGQAAIGDVNKLLAHLASSDAFFELWASHTPGAQAPLAEAGGQLAPVEIATVATSRTDLAAATRELAKVYSGPLCVYHVAQTKDNLTAMSTEIESALPDATVSIDNIYGAVKVEIPVVTPDVATSLKPFPDVLVQAAIRPAP